MFSTIKDLLKREKRNYFELLERGGIIIDVRTAQEFAQGNIVISINIPSAQIDNHIVKMIKKQNKPVITCCRSGARAESVATTLKRSGIEVYNAGSWSQLQASIAS